MKISNEVKTLLECLSEPAILLSQNDHIFAANAAYRHHYHYGKEDLLEHHYCYEVSHHYNVPSVC